MADKGHQNVQGRRMWGAGPVGVLLLLVRVRVYLFARLLVLPEVS